MNDSTQDIEQVITGKIQAALEPAQVRLNDMTGTRDHWEAVIISERFSGLRLIKRQQLVYQALGALMSGPIHAFTMQTLTPEEAEAKGIKVNGSSTDGDQSGGESGSGGSGSGGLISLG